MIGPPVIRREAHHLVFGVEFRPVGLGSSHGWAGDRGAVFHAVQKAVRFYTVVIDARTMSPAALGEIEGHGPILLSVRRRRFIVRRAIDLHRPGEETVTGVARRIVV